MEQLDAIWSEIVRSLTATPPLVATARLLIAACLGGLIGFEREINARSAGLRTHILIAMGACLFALVSFEIIEISQSDPQIQRVDPLRLIEAVTSGVAFLAAGSIIVSGGKVRGLTTGAGMWIAGAIGLACGIGQIGLAIIATGMLVPILWLLRGMKPAAADRNEQDSDHD
ncbi:MgtC/SapB family protein [Paracoccus sp. DMF-8]|uniref:MgtC/SapB family protein n=1 Tax=Paracoccus sp. DMF-8 TaxID=3019445 RepID=UPI0023E7D306|nr:MgtC/SapB family protein [Paracoccus sp. DMF-8]MDF3605185.1 MgtC/SapB family protein [Paracoccus sp. DMF-8]